MTDTDPGAVAIWHDISPEGREAFYAWHGNEHMHERVGIPGFRLGRRFVAIDADLEFFNLYEADSLAVLKGPDYRARLNSPTPWTTETVKHFRNVARAICRVAAKVGSVEGGTIATLRYEVEQAHEAAHIDTMRREWLPRLASRPGIAAARLLVADPEASGEMTAEKRIRAGGTAVPTCTLVVEGWRDEASFAALARSELAPARVEAVGARPEAVLGIYRHQITVAKSR